MDFFLLTTFLYFTMILDIPQNHAFKHSEIYLPISFQTSFKSQSRSQKPQLYLWMEIEMANKLDTAHSNNYL